MYQKRGAASPRPFFMHSPLIQKKMRNTKMYNQGRVLPGGNEFANMDGVQADLKKKIFRKGFKFTLGLGNNNFPITLSGDQRHLIGMMVYDETGDADNVVSLVINNLTIIEAVSQAHLCRIFGSVAGAQSNPLQQEVVPLNIPLGGEDAISYQCTAQTAGDTFVVFLYTCDNK